MKGAIIISGLASLMLVSCDNHEVVRSRLLEYRNNGVYTSAKGYAVKYTAYKSSIKKSYIWNIYETGSDALSLWVTDTTFVKSTYEFPSFSAIFKTGGSKTYHTTSGQLRLLGVDAGDLVGDFHCNMKNISDSNDSIVITAGYFTIFLEYRDSLLVK